MRLILRISLFLLLAVVALSTQAAENVLIDRIQLVAKQIELLKNRDRQAQQELSRLQKQHDLQISQLALEKASKKLLEKASLDILVAKSNLDSVNIELTDAKQTINWLDKNIQEIENQLNVLGMFGLKVAHNELVNVREYKSDLDYQRQLLRLERMREECLRDLQANITNILQLKKENYSRLTTQLKTYRLLNIKQQQVEDELAYQELQNYWLQQLNTLYGKINRLDPAKDKDAYLAAERDIFYANESASYAYTQSLLARYKDQIQQMRLAVFKSNSISLLNEISNQVVALGRQINRLDTVMGSRTGVIGKHIRYLSQRKESDVSMRAYVIKLEGLNDQYRVANVDLAKLNQSLVDFRAALDKALQVELSSRQGFPMFGYKMILDIGKEMLLVPPLTFHLIRSLTGNLLRGIESTNAVAWGVFAFAESLLLFAFFFLRKLVSLTLQRPAVWHKQINSKWLGLQWLQRNFVEFVVIGNMIGLMSFFEVPLQNYLFVIYLAMVWSVFKSIMIISRVCLIEATHDTSGHDVRLYHRLKWIILVGGVITAMTVFVHQLPLIYELKTLCDRLFLCFLMLVSVMVLRSWHVVPHVILSHMGSRHPYFEKSVRCIGFLIPIIVVCNSAIGLFGYVNLVMTISSYEGIFLVVLMAYLVLRGLLSDGVEQLSRLVIMHSNNGWLWTEAFFKPLDKVLRIASFLTAWLVLFLLYGWDKRSPIVERMNGLLHYKLAYVLNTVITPIGMIQLCVVVSIFYWAAKWTREFVYRLLYARIEDIGVRNSVSILSQYCVIVAGVFICLRVLGIDLRALTFVVSAFALGVGFGLRDLANNFACGFLFLLERPLRVGDIVNIGNVEGEVTHIGSRAVTVRTWDRMELVVPNAEIFNKSFTNWTFKDNIIRCVMNIKISRMDNPHEVRMIIHTVLATHALVLKEPLAEVFLKVLDDITMDFEVRYFVDIRQVKSRASVISDVLMNVWDAFAKHGIKPPYPQQEIFIRRGDVAASLIS